MHPLLFLILLVAGLLAISWYRQQPPARRRRVSKQALIGAGIAVLLLLLATGRLHPLFALLAAAVPLAQRALGLLQIANVVKGVKNAARGAAGPTPGQSSRIETRFLRMTLDHDTGELDGEVIDGSHRGRRLGELGLDDLLGLLAECRGADAQSAAVLEAYLDRTHGDEWRARAGGGGAGSRGAGASGEMSLEEARQVLGVAPAASREEIVAAHRRLMQKLHPDRGGSDYLAAKINQAKDLLLEDLAA